MKTFNAEEFNKHPNQVYKEAAKSGFVRINHLHFQDKIFEITCRDRRDEPPFCDLKEREEQSST